MHPTQYPASSNSGTDHGMPGYLAFPLLPTTDRIPCAAPARQRDADGARCCQRGSLGGTSVSPPEAATPAVATALASLSDDPLRRSSDAPLAPHPAAAHGDCLCVRAAASVA